METEREGKRKAGKADWTALHRRLEQVRQHIEDLNDAGPDRREQILRERTRALAKLGSIAEAEVLHADSIDAFVFQVAGERYAFEATYVAQVYPMSPLTALPGVPNFVVGITIFQGEVVSVIDLRSLLDLPLSKLTEPTSIIVLQGMGMEFGVLAEEIIGVENYPIASLEPSLPLLADRARTYLKGVTLDRTAILDAAQMLSDPGMIVDVA